jgi:HAD superfamily phosphatase (TIGR01668 family)
MDFSQLNAQLEKYWQNFKRAFIPKQKADTIYEVDPADLKAKGIKALILDLDDTLLPKTSSDITPKLYAFIENLKSMGFAVCISSNNRFPKRVEFIARTLNLPHISLAFKPLPPPFAKALEILGSKKEETAIIGDQLFTDILGGNLFGIHTVLVKPMTKEIFFLRQWMRDLEKFFLE